MSPRPLPGAATIPFRLVALVMLVLCSGGPGAPAQEIPQGKGPNPDRWPLNAKGLPRFTKHLAAGPNLLNLKNGSHYPAWVQVRSGDRAVEFLFDGKQIRKLSLPNGEYTIYFRFKTDVKMREGRSFIASNGGATFDDDKSKKKQTDLDINAKPGRKQ